MSKTAQDFLAEANAIVSKIDTDATQSFQFNIGTTF